MVRVYSDKISVLWRFLEMNKKNYIFVVSIIVSMTIHALSLLGNSGVIDIYIPASISDINFGFSIGVLLAVLTR